MNVSRVLKSAARRLPPIRRLADGRDAAAAAVAILEEQAVQADQRAAQTGRQLDEALTEIQRVRLGAALEAEAREAAEHRIETLNADLRAAGELDFDVDALTAAAQGGGRYRSCAWIEEGIFFSDKDVNLCCMQSIGNKTPKLFALGDKAPDFDEIQAAKRRFRIANQTNHAPCKGCYQLQENDWKAKDHLTFMAIAGFLHCNLSCSYCVTYAFDPKDRGGEVFEMIKALHAQGALPAGDSRLEWGGGESTFHKDFARIAAWAAESGVGMTVYTNATTYVPELENGLRSGLFNIVCSVDAGFADTYERIKGRDFLDKVWANLTRYAAINPAAVKLKYIIMEANNTAAELDEFMRRAVQSGAGVMIASPNAHNNTGADFKVSQRVEDAAVYLQAKGKAAGLYVGTSEFFEPELRERLEARASEMMDAIVVPSSLQANIPRPVEVVFVESMTFPRKIESIARRGDAFRVVLLQPVIVSDTPDLLLSMLSGCHAADVHEQKPLAEFIAQGRERISNDGEQAWPDFGGYELTAVFNRDRLAALDFNLP